MKSKLITFHDFILSIILLAIITTIPAKSYPYYNISVPKENNKFLPIPIPLTTTTTLSQVTNPVSIIISTTTLSPTKIPIKPTSKNNLTTPKQSKVKTRSYEDCVIDRESRGDSTAQNPNSTASGLYGFLNSTWQSVTGLPGSAKEYSASIQHQAFEKLYLQEGKRPWETDGC
jgi:hypothetical protein